MTWVKCALDRLGFSFQKLGSGIKDVPKEFRTVGGKASGVAGTVRSSGCVSMGRRSGPKVCDKLR